MEKLKLNNNLKTTLGIMAESNEFTSIEILNTIKQGKELNYDKKITKENIKEAVQYFQNQARNFLIDEDKEFIIGITNLCLNKLN